MDADPLKTTPAQAGRPPPTPRRLAHVREIIHADRCLTIREVAEDVGIAFGMCQKILTEDLQMRRVSAKFVPRLLTAEQKDNRMSISLTSMSEPKTIRNSCPQ